jgi:hypothetical protein
MSGPSIFHRWLWSLPLAASVICTGAAIRGDDTTATEKYAPELRRKVDRLVAELDAELRRTRDAARESLLALGPSILPLLPDERAVASAATRDSVRQIRMRLERQSALATLAASRVTLHGRFPLREILNQLAAQTGNQFESTGIDAGILRRELSIDDESRPFWSACDDVIHKAGLAYAPVHKPGRLKLLPAAQAHGGPELAVAENGTFRLSVLSAELRPSLGESRNVLRINWSLIAEPRLRPLFATIQADRLVVRASPSNVLKPVSPQAKWEISMGEGTQVLRLDSDFECPAGAEPAVVEFRGSLRVEMAAGPQRIVFENLSSGRREKQRAGGVTVALRNVEFPASNEKRGTARVEISLAYDQGGPAFESYRTWMYHNEAALESKTGRRIGPGPLVSTRQQGDGSVAVEYNFADVDATPGDYRFVYIAPTLIADLPVDFEFPRIPVARAAQEGEKR